MKTTIIKGGNCLVCPVGKPANPLLIWLDWTLRETLPGEIDVSLFLLTKDGIVASDADFIFYNQRADSTRCVRYLTPEDAELDQGKIGFWMDLERIPETVKRMAISLTYYGEILQSPPLVLDQAILHLQDGFDGNTSVIYEFTGDIQEETALIVGEVYRHTTGWKFRAIGQGFVGGLAALAMHFGVHLQDSTTENVPEESLEAVGVILQIGRKRRSPAEILAERTQQLKENLERFLPQIKMACHSQENEATTRMILDRVFQDVFGYEIDAIKAEQNIEGRRADYVLAVGGQDVLVVEVKRAGMVMRERQIFQATSYGAYSGIRWALLTNLLEWQLYRILTGDRIEATQVFAVNLKNGLDGESAYRLMLISAYGFSRKGLLDKLWLKLSTLSYERLAAVLLNQEVVSKIRSILGRESGITLTQEEVQTAIERNLLRLD